MLVALKPWIEQNGIPDHLRGNFRADAENPRETLRRLRQQLAPTSEARELVARASVDADRENVRALRAIPGIDANRFFSDPGTIERFREQNVNLISTLVDRSSNDLAAFLERPEIRNLHVEALTAAIQDEFEVSKSRARFWARDQTLKLNSQITHDRMRRAGIRRGIWTCSRDERVRGTPGGKWPRGLHYALDGVEFDLNDPPVCNEQGEKKLPGEDYECRCTTYPVTEDSGDAQDELI